MKTLNFPHRVAVLAIVVIATSALLRVAKTRRRMTTMWYRDVSVCWECSCLDF